MNVPQFQNRWMIAGTLTTESELHIGDGGAGALHCRARPAQKSTDNEEADAATVCTDFEGKAYVPGSAIKGTLRKLVSDPEGKICPDWERLLGSDSPDDLASVGGKLEFWDAFHTGGAGLKTEEPDQARLYLNHDRKRPWWDHTRKSCVAVAVSLNRRKRSAEENLLYHLEYVPAGETFGFEVSGDNLSEKEVAQLLLLLDQFNPSARIRATLGALGSNGWGRVTCTVSEIRCLNAAGIAAWKATPTAGLTQLPKIDEAIARRIETEKTSLALSGIAEQLVIELELAMESPWLIRDPRQSERARAAAAKQREQEDRPSDAVAIHDESGRPFVPAKSLRGALRARAEMILRTLDLACADHPADIAPVSTKGRLRDAVLHQIKNLDLAARLFGLSGWQAPLHVPRLVANGHPGEHHQEFLAIDRFVSGAAEHLKFNADLAGMTSVRGTLTVDLARLKLVDEQLRSIGLLALVLRDLIEGDIPIGSGSAKGQGFCTARVTIPGAADWRAHGTIARALSAFHNV